MALGSLDLEAQKRQMDSLKAVEVQQELGGEVEVPGPPRLQQQTGVQALLTPSPWPQLVFTLPGGQQVTHQVCRPPPAGLAATGGADPLAARSSTRGTW